MGEPFQPLYPTMNLIPRHFVCAAALYVLVSDSARAQAITPASEPSSASDSQQRIRLDVFEVIAEDDDGYRAANTTSGTRYNMPIRDLPISVDVVTEDFMRDIGAADLQQAMEYTVGLQQDVGDPARVNDKEAGGGLIRGLQVSNLSKDGFSRNFVSDPIGAGRIDVLKGPGGALYGSGNLGGAINLISPALTARPSYYFMQRYGTYGYTRTEARASGPLTRGGAIRFSLGSAFENRKYLADYDHLHAFTVNPKIEYNINGRTKITADAELLRRKWAHLDNGLITDPNSTLGVDIPGRVGAKVVATPDFRRFRWLGPDPHNNRRGYSYSLVIDHAFSDEFKVRVGANYQGFHLRTQRFGNPTVRASNASQIPVVVRNDPRFIALLRSDGRVLEYTQQASEADGIQGGMQYRTELFYAFRTGSITHRVNGGASYSTSTNAGDHYKFDPVYTNLPLEIALRRYRSLTDFTTQYRWDYEIPTVARTSWQENLTYAVNIFANVTSNAFQQRLTTMIGVMYTRNDIQRRNLSTADDSLISVAFMRPKPQRHGRPSFNASYRLTPRITGYTNFSKAFSPGDSNVNVDGNGMPLKIKTGNNQEYGVKAELLHDRIWATAAVFRNVVFNDRYANVPFAYNNQISSATGFGADVQMDTRAQGVELKLDWRATPEWVVNANFQVIDREVVRVDPLVTPNHPTPSILAAQLAAKPRDASVYLGKNNTNISKYMMRAFTKYEFRRGRLKGLWAFVGAKYDGARESIGTFSSDPEAPPTVQFVPSKMIYDVNIGYRQNRGRLRIDHLVKIENASNFDDWYFNAFYRSRTVQYSIAFTY